VSMADQSPDEAAHAAEERSQHHTVADIAAAVGLSKSTVSRALSGSPLVHAATRERILQATRELGYEPNRIAQSLSTRSSPFVGVVMPDIDHISFARMLKGARAELGRAGYQVLVMETEREPEQEAAAIRTLLAHRVAGILLATFGGYEPCHVPVVFFDHVLAGDGAGRVSLANMEGADLLVGHLHEQGHTRIGFIGGAPGSSCADERCEGFQLALARRWLAVPPEYVKTSDRTWSEESGEQAASELIALDPPPTAIMAADDGLAIGALRALRRVGRRVPEDVALVCFDDPQYNDVIDPPLTVVAYDACAVGASAAQLLLEQLSEPRAPRDVRIPVELIVRSSSTALRSPAVGGDGDSDRRLLRDADRHALAPETT
jgi:LacI family transcriptional regulator